MIRLLPFYRKANRLREVKVTELVSDKARIQIFYSITVFIEQLYMPGTVLFHARDAPVNKTVCLRELSLEGRDSGNSVMLATERIEKRSFPRNRRAKRW